MDYPSYVRQIEALYVSGLGQTGTPVLKPLPIRKQNPVVLIIAPHPDDECLMGGYALRLKLEANATVHVVPYSLGSKPERQKERDQELNHAIHKLGFERVGGVASNATQLLSIFKRLQPDYIFSPHANDGHATHIHAHNSCSEAIQNYEMAVTWIQTEFWQNNAHPNLLVGLSAEHVSLLGEALREHKGEVARNPYHLRLPAWFMDQVRRGSEKVGGVGGEGATFVFGQTYLQIECSGSEPSQWKILDPQII